jgi:hypothetical protein
MPVDIAAQRPVHAQRLQSFHERLCPAVGRSAWAERPRPARSVELTRPEQVATIGGATPPMTPGGPPCAQDSAPGACTHGQQSHCGGHDDEKGQGDKGGERVAQGQCGQSPLARRPAYVLLVIDGTWPQAKEMFNRLSQGLLPPRGKGMTVCLVPPPASATAAPQEQPAVPAQLSSASAAPAIGASGNGSSYMEAASQAWGTDGAADRRPSTVVQLRKEPVVSCCWEWSLPRRSDECLLLCGVFDQCDPPLEDALC